MNNKFSHLGTILSREQTKQTIGGSSSIEDPSDQTKLKCDKCDGYMPACCYVTVDCCYDTQGRCCNK